MPLSKCYILYDCSYITFSKWQNYRDKEHVSSCQGVGVGKGGSNNKGQHEELPFSDGTLLSLDCGGGDYTNLYK